MQCWCWLFFRLTYARWSEPVKRDAKWTNNPVVNLIKAALEKLGMKDQKLREQLLSLLSGYPNSWLRNHLGVGRVSITNAQDHASAGRLSIKLTSYETTAPEVVLSITRWTRIVFARMGATGSLCLTRLMKTCSHLAMITSIPIETRKF